MYGKAFSSMYTGSMMGIGAVPFAVWGYVIANMQPDKECGAQVELNPKLMAVLIGEPEKAITDAIELFCAPDLKSRTKAKEGRKLVKLGEFDYQVVNGEKYRQIRTNEERREYLRNYNAGRKVKSKPMKGEIAYVKRLESEGQDAADSSM